MCVLLACDDMRGGDDDARPGDPATSRDAQAAGGTDDPHDARRGGPDSRPSEHPWVRRLLREGGPDDRRQRVDAREKVEKLPRRHDRAQLADDDGALEVLPKLGAAGQVEPHDAEYPDDGEPGHCSEDHSSDHVERSER